MTNTRIKLLELKDVKFNYENSTLFLNIDDLVLRQGEKIGIIGDNGSGKSTIVKIILGLESAKGTVNLFERKVFWGNHYSQLGYIGDPSLSPGYTGLPTGVSVQEVLGCFKAISNQSDIYQIEKKLGLNNLLNKDVKFLSNGERKKLMIFLALVKRPKLLIADEATDGLDENSKQVVIELIENMIQNHGLSVLWISHQLQEVARLTDTIYRISGGKLEKNLDTNGFNCDILTEPKTSFSGNYPNLLSKGWSEIATAFFIDKTVSTLTITKRSPVMQGEIE